MIRYHLEKINPDIVMLCETWLSPALDNSLFHINGYIILRQDRSMGQGGGLIFYVKSTLVFETLFDNVNNNFILGDIESMLISVHKETLPIYIVHIYRPPSGKIDEYVKKCENIIESIYMLPKGRQGEIMILGY